jgi:hypothetical protein
VLQLRGELPPQRVEAAPRFMHEPRQALGPPPPLLELIVRARPVRVVRGREQPTVPDRRSLQVFLDKSPGHRARLRPRRANRLPFPPLAAHPG